MNQALQILQKYWGYSNFRTPQEQIIQSVLEGQDTLALMPTGGGKSICFQVPALCQEGICIVVSPLIALMKDQVYQLKKRNIAAEAIYSGMHYKEIDRILDNCIYGNVKLLYLSPERLLSELAKQRIAQMKVNLLAVDEAHCISQWGYDFRPPYLHLADIRALHPKVPILALTATATKEVEQDIQEKLAFTEKNVFRTTHARTNLAYVVLHEEAKENKLLQMVQKLKGSTIVYVRNRKKTKDLALFLQQKGEKADFYHAGLSSEERHRKQEDWINNKVRIIVSTNAFGMGIDKPDVRLVVHMDLPDSLEAYFQEAGRAGRDGEKAYAALLYCESDKFNLERSYEQSFPPFSFIQQVYRALGSYFQLAVGAGEGQSYDFDLLDFAKKFSLDLVKTHTALKMLEQEGWIVLTEAVFVPSQFTILVNKDELFSYQLEHPSFDKILKALLRTTQGSFSHYTKIKEIPLAKALNIALVALKQALLKMQQDRIIDYIPQKDKPQIVFIKERISADNLTIDHERYEFRKHRYHYRTKAAIHYAEHIQCRSQQLLQYLDEKNAPTCGVCDVCLGRHEDKISAEELENYKEKIRILLQNQPSTLKLLVENFTPKRQKKVLKVIEYLVSEGVIEQQADELKWRQ